MSKALSLNLRVRVLAALDAWATYREAGKPFGVPGERQPVAGEETAGR